MEGQICQRAPNKRPYETHILCKDLLYFNGRSEEPIPFLVFFFSAGLCKYGLFGLFRSLFGWSSFLPDCANTVFLVFFFFPAGLQFVSHSSLDHLRPSSSVMGEILTSCLTKFYFLTFFDQCLKMLKRQSRNF